MTRLRKLVQMAALAFVASQWTASALAQPNASKRPAAQKLGEHYEVAVVAVRSASEWKGMPAMGTLAPKEGFTFLVVEFAVKDLRSGKEDGDEYFGEFAVDDIAGQKYTGPFVKTNLREVPFAVPEPSAIAVFRIGGLQFPIQAMTQGLKKAAPQ